MSRNGSVKDARLNLEFAMHRARAGGIVEEQIANDAAVRAAGDRLTEAQASEHLRMLRTRAHTNGKRRDENDVHPRTV